jgi:hypothetical protein
MSGTTPDRYRQKLIVLIRDAVRRARRAALDGALATLRAAQNLSWAPGPTRGAHAGQRAQAVNVLILLVGLRPAVANVDSVLTLSPG